MDVAGDLSRQADISDCVDRLQLVNDSAHRTALSTDANWIAFASDLDDDTDYALRWEIASALDGIWEAWRDVAEEGRCKRSTEGVGRVLDEDLIVAINWYSQTVGRRVYSGRKG